MRAAFLDDARQDEVSHVVQDVLHAQGALVSDHSSSRVLFRGYKPSGKYTWDRSGYVGIYQHAGEPEVEVRLRLRARWPWRLLWLAALTNVIMIVTTIALGPSGTVWFAVAALGAFLLITTGLLYVNTWKPVWREERELMALLEAELEKGYGAEDVETAEERELRLLELQLEGELEKRRVREQRKREDADGTPKRRGGGLPSFRMPRPSFQLPGRKAKASESDAAAAAADANEDEAAAAAASDARIAVLEARRAELLARKAALAQERGEGEKKRRLPVSIPKIAMPRLGRKPKEGAGDADEESPEERRARLMARKAELEAQRAQQRKE